MLHSARESPEASHDSTDLLATPLFSTTMSAELAKNPVKASATNPPAGAKPADAAAAIKAAGIKGAKPVRKLCWPLPCPSRSRPLAPRAHCSRALHRPTAPAAASPAAADGLSALHPPPESAPPLPDL